MIYIFFKLFNTYHLLLKFTLTSTWAKENTYWPKNSLDVALGNFDDTIEFDGLVLFTP
jgi:hypothetical protein